MLVQEKKRKAPPRFELGISCLLDRRFNQLSHGASCDHGATVYIGISSYDTGRHPTGQNKKDAPNVGLEPTTLRLRVSCSTD